MMRSISSSSACLSTVEDVLRVLGVDPRHGLSAMDVAERGRVHGPNELEAEEPEPLWRKFLDKFKEPMIALLLASAGVSLLTKQYDDAISITLVRLHMRQTDAKRGTEAEWGGGRFRRSDSKATCQLADAACSAGAGSASA